MPNKVNRLAVARFVSVWSISSRCGNLGYHGRCKMQIRKGDEECEKRKKERVGR